MPEPLQPPETDPPQHLVGGLNVAILVAAGSDSGPAEAIKSALEELGANVAVLALAAPGADGQPMAVSQRITHADPDAYDAVVVPGGATGAQQLQASEDMLDFIRGIAREGKPIAAIGDGSQVLAAAGVEASCVLTAPDAAGSVEAFQGELKQLLAARRRDSFLTIGDDTPSAVGEDG
jgi:protease I